MTFVALLAFMAPVALTALVAATTPAMMWSTVDFRAKLCMASALFGPACNNKF